MEEGLGWEMSGEPHPQILIPTIVVVERTQFLDQRIWVTSWLSFTKEALKSLSSGLFIYENAYSARILCG